MKFKPVYLYVIIAIAAIAILIVVGLENSGNTKESPLTNNQTMPDDDVHKQLMNQGSTAPGKENVSEAYKTKLAELKNAVDENPSDTVALRKYADYLSASHKMSDAIPYYENILTINPRRADIHFALAFIYYNEQDFVKCQEENNKVLTFDPKNQIALYNLGAIAATQGKKVEAKEFWNKVISINAETETGKLATESLAKL